MAGLVCEHGTFAAHQGTFAAHRLQDADAVDAPLPATLEMMLAGNLPYDIDRKPLHEA